MYEKLGDERLKSGETLEVGVVTAPDSAFAPEVERLLGHKGREWRLHIEAALRGETDALENRFHVGLLGGKPIGNILTVERHGVGILGHVFTRPEHRRKGVCQAIMRRQMDHFRRRGGHVLLLGTGFESPPYWIYHSFGFRSLGGGFMRYDAAPGDPFERQWFAPGPAAVAEAQWRHWPLVALLASVSGKEFLRSAQWQIFGIGNTEEAYVRFMAARGRGANGVVLETERGAAVGCATVHPLEAGFGRWPGAWLLDVFTHPDFADRNAELVSALTLPPGKVVAYVDTGAGQKAAALEACGFTREGTLRRFLRAGDTPRDVWIYGKEG